MMQNLGLFFCYMLIVGQGYSQSYDFDDNFLTGTGFNSDVNAVVIDTGGKLLVGGAFTEYNGIEQHYIARLNVDGTLDGTFDPDMDFMNPITELKLKSLIVTVLTDGEVKRFWIDDRWDFDDYDDTNEEIKTVALENHGGAIIIGGEFTYVGMRSAKRIARIKFNGSFDQQFDNNVGTGFNNTVRKIEITSSGKILVAGDFSSFNGVTRNRIALLNNDGTLDTSFNPGTSLSNTVESLAVQDDGKILAGTYSFSHGAARLVRFNTDGSEEFSSYIYGASGGGAFEISTINTKEQNDILLGLYSEDGLVSIDFDNGSVIDISAGNGIYWGYVNTITRVDNGALILGGSFNQYNGISVKNIIRVANSDVEIIVQPENAFVCETNNTSFSVSATGSGTLQYQWQLNTNSTGAGLYFDIDNSSTYSGANSPILNLTSVNSSMNEYYYRCIITDNNCSSTTEPKQLKVKENIIFTTNPLDATVCAGNNSGFSVNVVGANGEYQWQEDPGTGIFYDLENGAVYQNVNQSFISLIGVTEDMSGYKYRLKSSKCDPQGMFSEYATLIVHESAEITSQPVGVTLCVSGDASFSVYANSGQSISYKWQYFGSTTWVDLYDNTVYSGTNTSNLLLSDVDNTLPELNESPSNLVDAFYRCVLISNACVTYSDEASLIIYGTPNVITQPVSYSDCVQKDETKSNEFIAEVDINESYVTFQWEYDDGSGFVSINDNEVYSGSNLQILNLSEANIDYNGSYRCKIGECSTTVYTDIVNYTLELTPEIDEVSDKLIRVCQGSNARLEITSSVLQVTYQWQLKLGNGVYADLSDGGSYLGSQSSILQLLDLSNSNHLDKFRCKIVNVNCHSFSDEFTLEVYNTPTISKVPLDRNTCDNGDAVSFVTGAENFISTFYRYQWQEAIANSNDFEDITDDDKFSGLNDTRLEILQPVFSMNGNRYRLSVIGCEIPVYSESATLTVDTFPIISEDPQSKSVCHDEPVTFSVLAIGSNLTYTWWRDTGGGNYEKVTASSSIPEYTFNARFEYNGYKYKCLVESGNCGQSKESIDVTLTVHEVEIVSTTNTTVTACTDATSTFSVEMSDEDGLEFQWTEDGNIISDNDIYSGANSSTLVITNPTLAISSLQCLISSSCGNASTGFQLITYGTEKPVVTALLEDPNNKQLVVTTDFQFPPDNFEWFLDRDLYQNTGSEGIVSIEDDGSYTVIATRNGCDHPESDEVVILVTGIDNNLSTDDVYFYPNPVRNRLVLELGNDFVFEGQTGVIITNISGKEVLNTSFNSFLNLKMELDMSSYKSGMYLIRVTNGERQIQYKVRKE